MSVINCCVTNDICALHSYVHSYRAISVFGWSGWIVICLNWLQDKKKISVNFCNRKIHQKLKSCAAPGWHDALDEEGKDRHWKTRQNLVCSPGSYVYIEAKVRWEKPASIAGSNDPGENSRCTRSHCTQKPEPVQRVYAGFLTSDKEMLSWQSFYLEKNFNQ